MIIKLNILRRCTQVTRLNKSKSSCSSKQILFLIVCCFVIMYSGRTRLNELFEDLVMLKINQHIYELFNILRCTPRMIRTRLNRVFLTWFDGRPTKNLVCLETSTFTFYLESTLQRPLLFTFTWVTFFRCTFTST